MSNETKREVLKKALDFFVMYGIEQSINYDLKRYQYLSEYDDALPDDLPVIAEVASEHIKMQKNDKRSLYQSFKSFHTSEILNQYELFDQLENSSEQYARAWLLGVWRVEETGEIVKLEAEK
ncbi:hypothetical protein [Lacticaseibacillus paracasei]|uniref:hypothetical protein n=1 Tax=Lacticaseibacillus paracasei TaxID=1597 RepID=UPI000E098C2D|nr:hypothetical protein [Lacticaseibacillus paracasei]RDG24690.1 hypothetical protein DQM17_07050 [Lacticaseibacillus paracasei]